VARRASAFEPVERLRQRPRFQVRQVEEEASDGLAGGSARVGGSPPVDRARSSARDRRSPRLSSLRLHRTGRAAPAEQPGQAGRGQRTRDRGSRVNTRAPSPLTSPACRAVRRGGPAIPAGVPGNELNRGIVGRGTTGACPTWAGRSSKPLRPRREAGPSPSSTLAHLNPEGRCPSRSTGSGRRPPGHAGHPCVQPRALKPRGLLGPSADRARAPTLSGARWSVRFSVGRRSRLGRGAQTGIATAASLPSRAAPAFERSAIGTISSALTEPPRPGHVLRSPPGWRRRSTRRGRGTASEQFAGL